MTRREPGYFRGTELPRLLLLAALLVGGWASFLTGWRPWEAAAPAAQDFAQDSEAGPGSESEPVEPDEAAIFEAVRDKTRMGLTDNAPLKILLERARGRTPEQLAAEARTDVLMTHLIERPHLYRGVPIRIAGSALRSLTYEVAPSISPKERLYEAWVVVQGDAQKFPYACVFEDRPPGFPISATISERVVFNGYFLKVMQYVTGDRIRYAPLLVGKLGWTPPPEPGVVGGGFSFGGTAFTAVALGALIIYGIVRWSMQARRLMGIGRAVGEHRPLASPEPEPPADMGRWLESLPDEDDDADDGPAPPP